MGNYDGKQNLLPGLLLLAGSFLAGLLAGTVIAGTVSGGGSDALSCYLEGYLAAVNAGSMSGPPLLPLLWELFRWPVAVVLLGLIGPGLVALPVLFALRGFFLAFAIGSFVRMFGSAGCLLAAPVFGVSGLISIPVLFVLGVCGWNGLRVRIFSSSGEGKRSGVALRRDFLRWGSCTGLLVLCVALERLAVPPLLASISKLFLH